MLIFWVICILLILVALVIMLPSLLSKGAVQDLDRNKINRALYEKKKIELENDLKNDLIDQDQYEVARSDLERSLLDDFNDDKNTALKPANKLLPIFILVLLPVAAIVTYLSLDNGLASLDPDFQKKMAEQQAKQAAGQMGSVDEAIASLQEKVQQDPDNLENLKMLARSYVVTQQFEEAVITYSKANEITNGADPDLLVSLGEAKGFAAGNRFDESAMALFDKALQIDPKNERGLWYAGLAAYQLEDFSLAVTHLEKLVDQVPENEVDVKSALLKYLNDAKQKAGIVITQADQTVKTDRSQIKVNVSLGNDMASRIVKSDTLFVYARAMSGPKMPLALVKMTAGDLPATVTLDDSVSMIAGMTLSSMDQVEIIARISKSGQAVMQTGDLFGTAKSVKTDQSEVVDVIINELAP